MSESSWKVGARRFAVVAATITTVGALSACGSSDKKDSSSKSSSGTTAQTGAKKNCTTNILLVDNFTGAGSSNGKANVAGAKIAVNEVNKAGGVLGCQLKMDTQDDASDYSKDAAIVQKATAQKKYALVSNDDFACVTTAPLLQRLKILNISACAQTNFAVKSNPTTFDVVYIAARAAAVAAQYALKQGHKKFAILADNTELGKGDIAAIKDVVSKGGGQVVDAEQLPLDGVNFSAAVQRARSKNPDIVFTDLFGAAAGHLKSDIYTSGWKVPQIGGFDEGASAFKGLAPAAALKGQAVVSMASMASPSDAKRQAFIDQLHARGETINGFLFGYANGHDPVTLFAYAANKAGSLDAQKMADVLHNGGDDEIPNLLQGKNTGYSPTCGEWNSKDGLAVMKEGFYDENGRLPRISLETAPPLPASLNKC